MESSRPLVRGVKALTPPALLDLWRRWRHPRMFEGNYATWAAASAASAGYADPNILERVTGAARAVRDGRAAFERDGIAFATSEYHWPVLGALASVAARRGGRLTVVDFGGGMGSLYFQHRAWFAGTALDWRVVEQDAWVAVGEREFADGRLRFFRTLEAALAAGPADVALLASVLPYVPEPHALLQRIAAGPFDFLVIDRTGVTRSGRDRLTVQHVPPALYRASYPSWFFGRDGLLRSVGPAYRLAAEWPNADPADIPADYRGFLFERNPVA